MTISATEREELRGLVLEAFGQRGADLLMAGLAGTELEAMEERLALRIDLVRSDLHGEMAELRGEFRAEFGELRGEFGELKGQFGELKGYVGTEIGAMRTEISALPGEIAKQNKYFLFTLIGCLAGIGAIVVAALQIAG